VSNEIVDIGVGSISTRAVMTEVERTDVPVLRQIGSFYGQTVNRSVVRLSEIHIDHFQILPIIFNKMLIHAYIDCQ